jgi:hypothetical protein
VKRADFHIVAAQKQDRCAANLDRDAVTRFGQFRLYRDENPVPVENDLYIQIKDFRGIVKWRFKAFAFLAARHEFLYVRRKTHDRYLNL